MRKEMTCPVTTVPQLVLFFLDTVQTSHGYSAATSGQTREGFSLILTSLYEGWDAVKFPGNSYVSLCWVGLT